MRADHDPLDGVTPLAVADELVSCRRRGIGRLEAVVGSEPTIELPVLDGLCARRGPASPDRGIAVGTLIRDGIAALSRERPDDGRLMTELFFGDPPAAIPASSPGQLLDAAVRRRGGVNEAAFRRERKQVCLRLGRVLLDLAKPDGPLADPRVQTGASEVLTLAQDPGVGIEELFEHLRPMAREYEVSEVFAVITRFDTPDVLG